MPKRPNPELVDDENPEWTHEVFARARPAAEMLGEAFMERVARKPGRPKAEEIKQPVSLRLRPAVVKHLRESGAGWQTRVDDALAELIAQGRL